MIPDDLIARVRESVDLVGLVRESVPSLKKSGRNYQARCPFHQERTPSFSVNSEMGLFKCFGCGVGGDAFKFVMLIEGLTYPEAIRKLAARVGITVEERRSAAASAESRERDALYRLLEEAARFYHRHLLESPETRSVTDYLHGRGLTQETLIKFQVGFAPASGQALRDAAAAKGHSVEILEKAGLVRRQEGSGRVHDHFWNRVIFPITDTQGRVVAFGGRALGEAMPKYINSPETPVYSKSRHLYGLFEGLPAVRKGRQLLILEGYVDVAMCHQYGFEFAAATLGTALTPDHARLLRRYVDSVTLLFDPDAAGAQATLRGGELLLGEAFSVKVVMLPDGLDADELLVRHGKAKLDEVLAGAVPFLDYCLTQALMRFPGSTPEGKLAAAKVFLPLLQKVREPLLQDEYLGKLAEALKVDKGVLGRQMSVLEKGAGLREAASSELQRPAAKTVLSLEEEILLVMLLRPAPSVAERLAAHPWQDLRCRRVWEIAGTRLRDNTLKVSEILPALSEDLQEWLGSLVMQPRVYKDPGQALDRLLESWQRQQASTEWTRLGKEINAMIDGQAPADAQKITSYKILSQRLKGSPKEMSQEA